MSYTSIQSQSLPADIINTDVQTLDNIKRIKSQKAQLKKVSTEFEAIFVTKMISALDKTVDKEGGIFGEDNKYMDKFKSFIYNEVGRQIASNPHSTVGFAKQIYSQMEKSLPKETDEITQAAQTAKAEAYKKVDKEI